MKIRRTVFIVLGLTVAACDPGGTGDATGNICVLQTAASPDGTSMLTGNCKRDADGIAVAIAHGDGHLTSGGEIALGRTPFGPAGAFDRCAVMAHLSDDPRWTASIDSGRAGVPLADALKAVNLAPPISDALARVGRRLHDVSLETVLLSDKPARDCPKSPARIPTEAQIWLSLE